MDSATQEIVIQPREFWVRVEPSDIENILLQVVNVTQAQHIWEGRGKDNSIQWFVQTDDVALQVAKSHVPALLNYLRQTGLIDRLENEGNPDG